MTTTEGRRSFLRTVDRRTVHRQAVAEVFLTDMWPTGDMEFGAAAQLPLTHGYYNDHTQTPCHVDPLLVLEAARQASIYGAHELAVPLETSLIVNSFSVRLTNLAPLVVGRRPTELTMATRFKAVRTRGGRPRTGHVIHQLHVGTAHVGVVEIEVLLVSYGEHDALRNMWRDTPARSTACLPDVVDRDQLPPQLVGRVHPVNVVLAEPRRTHAGVLVRVTPRLANRALFDHDYDHVPALTLTEAARQLALYAADDGTGAVLERTSVAGLAGRFHRFAELDEPITALARVAAPDTRVVFRQGGNEISEITVTLSGGGHA
ncbi:AfsA-related hotdog domain-containing protein [Kutzneria buriramensis]|nr:AfsA-related hotdog domain-containing protein [Kutzneria buriramensis]